MSLSQMAWRVLIAQVRRELYKSSPVAVCSQSTRKQLKQFLNFRQSTTCINRSSFSTHTHTHTHTIVQPVIEHDIFEGNEAAALANATTVWRGIKENYDEVKDASLVFNPLWEKLERQYGKHNLKFPKEIIWLMGAPGSGKGTHTPFINKARGITAQPIVMSELLASPEASRLKSEGRMVGDMMVLELLLHDLLKPGYENGVVVDGFPRTKVQVECIKMLHDKMTHMRKEFFDSDNGPQFRRPAFRVAVLFVEEEESVRRQLKRGMIARKQNQQVLETGEGDLIEERPTDFSEDLARHRYFIFKEHFSTLKSLREHFAFSLINASGSIESVQQSIITEFEYQSENEIAIETLDVLQRVPLVSELKKHARQALVKRLDEYVSRKHEQFNRVVAVIESEVIPVLELHSLSGRAVVRTPNLLFDEPSSVAMLIDAMSERGFHVTYDMRSQKVPVKFNQKTGEITTENEKAHIFQITFEATKLRVWRD